VVLRDFAENYSFTLLDDAQGYHCNSAWATMHPLLIYFEKIIWFKYTTCTVALCYKLEDRGFDSRCHRIFFNWPNPSICTMVLGFTQPLTEMRTRKSLGNKARPTRKAGNLTAICEPMV
jgi:hypothetical protein